jgi:hypothetical protein
MSPQVIFWLVFLAFVIIIIYFDKKFDFLRDSSTAAKKPYSLSRVQLALWTLVILASMVSIVLYKGIIPTFNTSTLILLGISSATTATGRMIDLSDQSNQAKAGKQNKNSEGFFLDLLSDSDGVSIHRFQAVVFNLVFGIWFMCTVLYYLIHFPGDVSKIIPEISDNNLILLGLSSGTYAALKATENKQKTITE